MAMMAPSFLGCDEKKRTATCYVRMTPPSYHEYVAGGDVGYVTNIVYREFAGIGSDTLLDTTQLAAVEVTVAGHDPNESPPESVNTITTVVPEGNTAPPDGWIVNTKLAPVVNNNGSFVG
jgi:hypothetical protein